MRKESYVERVMIVLNPDGSLKAAQGERLERYFNEEGGVTGEIIYPAEPLDAEALAKVLPDRAALLAEVERLRRAAPGASGFAV
jgi:hypothetical protein